MARHNLMEPSTLHAALIGGHPVETGRTFEVRNPLDGRLVATVARGSADHAVAAVESALSAMQRPMPVHLRYTVLQRAADLVEQRADELSHIIAAEGSKSIREARREPPRAATILRLSAEAARRADGGALPFDIRPDSEGRRGYWTRRPAGVVAAIMPFNDPLGVTAHKVGPAIAAGNAVVVKPDSRTPLSVLALGQILAEAGLAEGRVSVVPGEGPEVGAALVEHPGVRIVAFTGGVNTGRTISRAAGIKKLLLELGANSPVIVLDDARLDAAAQAVAEGAFAQAGQNCLGVQRVLVHPLVHREFVDRLVRRTEALVAGHSLDESTDVCSLISEQEAERVSAWIDEAVAGGGALRCGGVRTGALLTPAVIDDVPEGARLNCDEVYGPVVGVRSVPSLEAAIEAANAVPYGLQAAVFTEDLRSAFTAADRLEVGAVIINDSTDYRLDIMPFGGPKQSGLGREGIEHAIQEMSEPKVLCFNL